MSDLNDQLDKYKTANKITMPHYLEYIDSLKWHLFDSHSAYDYLNTSKNPFSRLNREKFSQLNESSLVHNSSSSISKDLEMINTKQAIDIINLITSDEDEKMQKADHHHSVNMIEEKIEEDEFNEEALNNLSFDDCVVSKDKYIPKKKKNYIVIFVIV